MNNINNQFNQLDIPLDARSKELRKTILEIFKFSRRGHLAPAFSLIEIFRVLYDDILNYQPDNPAWTNRDRCILSKGHGCLALYVLLADKGFFPTKELWKFCQLDGLLGGHPEYGKIPGIEASTGSLGHGLSIGIGMALSARINKQKHRVFVILGDGETNEGSVWEGALCAGKHKLENLTLIIDYNKLQSYGSTFEVQDLEPYSDKWKSFGFTVHNINGHDINSLKFCLQITSANQPQVIICHTVKGKGIRETENNLAWHHKSGMKDEDILRLEKSLFNY
jgi:transketolase